VTHEVRATRVRRRVPHSDTRRQRHTGRPSARIPAQFEWLVALQYEDGPWIGPAHEDGLAVEVLD